MYEEEIRLMQKIPPHPNCIALLDSFVFEGEGGQEHYSFVMPMMAGTDLFKFIRENVRDGERLNPIIAHHLSRQLLAGIAHLAEAGVVHSDLKIENLLVEPVESSTVLHLRIADFGTAMETGGRLRQYGHTYEYRAPEIIMGHLMDDADAARDMSTAIRALQYAFHEDVVRRRCDLPRLMDDRDERDLVIMVSEMAKRSGSYEDRTAEIQRMTESQF